MAIKEHIEILFSGFKNWNKWREENPGIRPDLSNTDLQGLTGRFDFEKCDLSKSNISYSRIAYSSFQFSDLFGTKFQNSFLRSSSFSRVNGDNADFRNSDLVGAFFSGSKLMNTNYENSNLQETTFNASDLYQANFSRADLRKATFQAASLLFANISNASLIEADLSGCNLSRANLSNSDLSNSKIYGISAWDLNLEGTKQNNLIITPENHVEISVDNIEFAQFIYLLINNENIRKFIDTITSKCVLILGRFTAERKYALESIKLEIREQGYLPIIFDFSSPSSRDINETVSLLASISLFVIADITDPRSIPQELNEFVVRFPSIFVQPVIHESQEEYGMFSHFSRYPWVFPIIKYNDPSHLSKIIREVVLPMVRLKSGKF